jgi:hypothetical protein
MGSDRDQRETPRSIQQQRGAGGNKSRARVTSEATRTIQKTSAIQRSTASTGRPALWEQLDPADQARSRMKIRWR